VQIPPETCRANTVKKELNIYTPLNLKVCSSKCEQLAARPVWEACQYPLNRRLGGLQNRTERLAFDGITHLSVVVDDTQRNASKVFKIKHKICIGSVFVLAV
jgi:hypothetical protein